MEFFWLRAVLLQLLLDVTRVNTEHLQAENLNLLFPKQHNLVLNQGMKGRYFNIFVLSNSI